MMFTKCLIFRNSYLSGYTQINRILEYCKEPKSAKEIRDYIGISSKIYFASNIIKLLLEKG